MRGNKGKNAIPVNQYNKNWEFMKRYPSIKDAAAETGIKAGVYVQPARVSTIRQEVTIGYIIMR